MMRLLDRIVASVLYRIRSAATRHEDRAALGQCASVGPGTTFRGRVRLNGGEAIHLGANVVINDNADIRGEGGLVVGDNTKIARNVVIYTINHQTRGTRLPYDSGRVHRPVTIGRNVWIGANVCIAPGASIGDGAIVGMGTVVAGDVEPLAIVTSGQMRVVGRRDATDRRHRKHRGVREPPEPRTGMDWCV